jgi:hypothetical protein
MSDKDEDDYYYSYRARNHWVGNTPKEEWCIQEKLEFGLKENILDLDLTELSIEYLEDFLGTKIGRVLNISENGIIIPYTTSIEKLFSEEPNVMAIFGERSSGKTVGCWNFAFKLYTILNPIEIHVYGDIDGVAQSIKTSDVVPKEFYPFRDSIIEHDNYTLPKIDPFKRKIVLFNELSEELISKRAMASANLAMNMLFFRARHLNEWVISNIIRAQSFESTLRDTSMIKMLKPMYGSLLENVEQYFPRQWKNIVRYASEIPKTEGICFYPLMEHGGGMAVELYEVKPEKWLLACIENAVKNLRLLEVLNKGKEERPKEIKEDTRFQQIIELRKIGLSQQKIARKLRIAPITVRKVLKKNDMNKKAPV